MQNQIKDTLIYTISFFLFVTILMFLTQGNAKETKMVIHDTITSTQDTPINVSGKVALFIGDSHTANYVNGWQVLVCNKTGMKMINPSVSGKTTYWMLDMGLYKIRENIDYCFIYGGANDIHGNRNPYEVVGNIQKIVDICNSKGVKAFVLTGFDAEKCVRPIKGQEFYPKAYSRYQRILMENIKGANVIDTRVVVRTDCGDWTCHMNPSGHRKVANAVIKQMKFKNY